MIVAGKMADQRRDSSAFGLGMTHLEEFQDSHLAHAGRINSLCTLHDLSRVLIGNLIKRHQVGRAPTPGPLLFGQKLRKESPEWGLLHEVDFDIVIRVR